MQRLRFLFEQLEIFCYNKENKVYNLENYHYCCELKRKNEHEFNKNK